MKDRIQLSDHFTYQRLIRFVLPSIGMMIFTSIYGAVDGLFVSNFAGKSALAAVNLIMPFPMLLGVLGFMIGTGGNVIIAKTLGEGEHKKANEYFSMLIYVTMAGGVIFTVLVLPMFLLIDGVWAAIAVSEVLALVVTFFFFAKEKKRYGYL